MSDRDNMESRLTTPIDKPSTKYVAYKPGWMDQWMLALLILDIVLLAVFLVYGSIPSREARSTSQQNRYLMCAAQQDDLLDMPEPWNANVKALCDEVDPEGP